MQRQTDLLDLAVHVIKLSVIRLRKQVLKPMQKVNHSATNMKQYLIRPVYFRLFPRLASQFCCDTVRSARTQDERSTGAGRSMVGAEIVKNFLDLVRTRQNNISSPVPEAKRTCAFLTTRCKLSKIWIALYGRFCYETLTT